MFDDDSVYELYMFISCRYNFLLLPPLVGGI